MSWDNHIKQTVSRTRKLIYIFKNLRSVLDPLSLRTVYLALAQSIFSYCITAWGGSAKTILLRLERSQRAVLKVMAKKPFRFPTVDLFSLSNVLTVRQLFIFNTVLRKHSQLSYDPTISTKRRSDRVCRIESRRTELASRHNYLVSSMLYNRANKELNIYSLTLHKCKTNLFAWLQPLSYNETENLLTVIV